MELALEREVHAALLAGDVVEKNEDRFQAFGPLEAGVGRLRKAGIEVLGVAGNHDDIALPRLARAIDGFRFLGEGGVFELACVETGGGAFGVLGWSFPERVYRKNPLERLGEELRRKVDAFCGGPVLGLLHTQIGGGEKSYAPTRQADLESIGVSGWFLGHVHQPSLAAGRVAAGTRPLGYLGSVSACDIGEAGPRGPWLATIEDGRLARLEQLVLTPVRFERLVLDLSPFDGASESLVDDATDALRKGAARLAEEAAGAVRPPEALALRLVLTGRHARHRELVQHFETLVQEAEWSYSPSGIVCYLEGLEDDARPALDLEELAETQGPIGLMARRVRELEDAAPEEPDADDARMLRVARDLLEDLIAVKEGS